MKSYIQGLITGAVFVFATFIFIGATDPIAIELINGLTDSVDGLTKAVENNRNRIKDNAAASNKQYASFKELHLWVKQNSEAIIKEACGRELHRGGQVYFLHNDVSSIERMAEHLRQLLPNAGIQVAHGQMPRTQLEPVMRDFYHQRFDILVCSTIIESGIDVPTANTIIINRADRFGLAQLHQLRGRVGRSKHQAFAFLLTPDPAAVSETAERRLTAIAELTDLGVGFALANHDLEIRGAGEILGEDQSGAIEEIGFSLYTEYLNRAIHSLADSGQLRSGLDPSRL